MDNRITIGKKAGIIGIVANIVLFIAKICASIISGSLSIVADAVNNLTDALSAILVYLGYHISGKPADKEHPYGHARMEYICSLLISVLVTFLGIEFFRESIGSLVNDRSRAVFSVTALIIMISSVAVKAFLAVFYNIVAKKIDSAPLKASAADSIGDILATGAVILGMLLTPVFGPKCDAVFGLLMSGYILFAGIKLICESADTLIGRAPSDEFVHDLTEKIKAYKGVLGTHDLVIHNYGAGKYFVSIHVEVDADGDMLESHDMIDNIENDLSVDGLRLTVHMDPVQYSNPEVMKIRDEVLSAISEFKGDSEFFSMHDFRVVFGITHTNILFDLAIPHDYPLSNDELSVKLKKSIKAISSSYNGVITIDRGYETTRYS